MARESSDKQGSDQRKRSRRRRRPARAPESPAQVIVQAKPVDTTKPADVPLSATEVVEMREHFKFLRDNRKLLQLRLNAAEDLLINGAREPTHRGVCLHLLGKVDRARVELAAPRLDPAARSRFLAGIVKLSPDVAYLLLYLESVKESASQQDATAALSRALRQIDFSQISSAQMRRLLDLIADLFDERDRPQLLFGLLQSPTFRDAFDRSAEQLPPSLGESFVPLRAAHAVVLRGKKNPYDGDALAAGVRMLLSAREKVLRAHQPMAQKRLFELGVALGDGALSEVGPGLVVLAKTLPEGSRERSDALLHLAGLYLGAGREGDAKKLLEQLRKEAPSFRTPMRWLDALSGPRFGQFAVPTSDAKEKRGKSRFQVAFALDVRRPVWLRVGTADEAPLYLAAQSFDQSLVVPGVLRHAGSGVTRDGAPYFAVPRRGPGAFETLKQEGEVSYADAMLLCEDVATMFSALGDLGVTLPDVRLDRFTIAAGPRFWLRDILGVSRLSPEAARSANLDHAKELCSLILAPHAAASVVRSQISSSENFLGMLRTLSQTATI